MLLIRNKHRKNKKFEEAQNSESSGRPLPDPLNFQKCGTPFFFRLPYFDPKISKIPKFSKNRPKIDQEVSHETPLGRGSRFLDPHASFALENTLQKVLHFQFWQKTWKIKPVFSDHSKKVFFSIFDIFSWPPSMLAQRQTQKWNLRPKNQKKTFCVCSSPSYPIVAKSDFLRDVPASVSI